MMCFQTQFTQVSGLFVEVVFLLRICGKILYTKLIQLYFSYVILW